MIWRLFDIFGYVDLLRKIMITKFVSVLEGSLIFNKYTFLFIYLFFCYNYSFIYLFFRNSFPSFFFFLYESQKNNSGISFFHLKYYFSRALSLIIFSNISWNLIVDGIPRPSSEFIFYWNITSLEFHEPYTHIHSCSFSYNFLQMLNLCFQQRWRHFSQV